MTTWVYIHISTAAFFLIFLRGLQQQNVVHGNYKLAVLTAFGLAVADVLVIFNASQYGLASIFPVGVGAACGVTLSMYIHKRFIHKKSI